MTTVEMSNKFDLGWDNLRYNDSGYSSLNEYEKSLFLTQAQEALYNKYYQEFDSDEYAKRILTPLVKTFKDVSLYEYSNDNLGQGDFNSIKIALPVDLNYILTEKILTVSNKSVMVKPLKLDQYNILKDNPFRKPSKNKAWRTEIAFDYGYKTQEEQELSIPYINNKFGSIELITSYEITELSSYFCRYLKYPTPIILEDIDEDDYKIRGYKTVTEAILNNIIHEEIVDLAIQLASQALYKSATK